jgi:hypothetical protein
MDMQQRRAAFSKRFNAALQKGGKAGLSDGSLVKLLAREGVGVSSASVANWRNAKHMPKLEQIEGVARMLGVDPGELAFGKPRTAEARAVYGGAGDEQAVLDGLTLLGEREREVLRDLIGLLGPRGPRPGRRKAGTKS